MFEIIRVHGHRFGISETDEHHHDKTDEIEVFERIQRQPAGVFCGRIPAPQRYEPVRDFMKNEPYTHGDERKKQVYHV